jgi:predicted nucleic-acid-binding protein
VISVDTNVIVRLLTGDDQSQFKRAKALFEKVTIVITTTVILESEWVLRYAYNYEQSEITNAFKALFGLPDVNLQEPLVMSNAIEWYQQGMDFTDAIHLAKSQDAEGFVTFDKKLISASTKMSIIPVKEP